jgi:hypothetical protein
MLYRRVLMLRLMREVAMLTGLGPVVPDILPLATMRTTMRATMRDTRR